MNKFLALIIMAMLFAKIGMAGCFKAVDSDIISGTGTVKYIDLEGGFYGIISDDGKHYDPVNLPKEFQVDNLRVRFKAKIRRDMISFRMWGTLVEILEIERLK